MTAMLIGSHKGVVAPNGVLIVFNGSFPTMGCIPDIPRCWLLTAKGLEGSVLWLSGHAGDEGFFIVLLWCLRGTLGEKFGDLADVLLASIPAGWVKTLLVLWRRISKCLLM